MSNNNQQQGQRRVGTLSDLAQGKKKIVVPDFFKGTIFVCLGWAVLAGIMYASGVFHHKGDSVDYFVSWSSGFCGIFGLVFLAFAFYWYEEH